LTKSNCRDFIVNDEWLQFIRPQSSELSDLRQCRSLITSCNRSKQVAQLKDALQLI